jgi:hypothetical protein
VESIVANNFYSRVTHGNNFYVNGGSTEPDMRQELINMFDGKYPEIPKAQTGLLRVMRRDSNGMEIPCPCVDVVTKEPDKERFCPLCFGEGFYWDEVELQFYAIPAERRDLSLSIKDTLEPMGLINVPTVVFYVRYDSPVHLGDKVIRLVTTVDGEIIEPQKRRDMFRINSLWDFRSDRGRIEYWKLFAHKEKFKYLNMPTYNGV